MAAVAEAKRLRYPATRACVNSSVVAPATTSAARHTATQWPTGNSITFSLHTNFHAKILKCNEIQKV